MRPSSFLRMGARVARAGFCFSGTIVPASRRASVSTSRSAPSCLFRADSGFRPQQHIARVESGVDAHGGDPSHGFPVGYGPLNRRRPAILGQQRGMNIDDAMRRQVDDGLRNDLPIPDHDHGVGVQRSQFRNHFRPSNPLRLKHRQAQPQRSLLDGRSGQSLSAPLRPIGLCNHRKHRVTGLDNLLQSRNGKQGSTEKDHSHGGTFDF